MPKSRKELEDDAQRALLRRDRIKNVFLAKKGSEDYCIGIVEKMDLKNIIWFGDAPVQSFASQIGFEKPEKYDIVVEYENIGKGTWYKFSLDRQNLQKNQMSYLDVLKSLKDDINSYID